MIIDAHVHIGNFSASYPFAESKLEKVVQILRDEGMDYALVSSAKSLLYDCPEGNKEALAASKQYKEILPYLVVNPLLPDEALKELKNWRQKGFIGVKLHPNLHHYSLHSQLAEPVLKICEEQQIPILTHSTGGDPLSGAQAIKDAAEKFPDLILVIGHGGIFSDREVAQVAKDYPQLYIEISVEYEAGKLEKTIEMIGTDRIIFGSDCPLHHPSVMLKRIQVMKLPKEDEEKILWKTAQRVFSLKLGK